LAVGQVGGSHPLIESWNGTAWSRVPVHGAGSLIGVAARSARRAWAVGMTGSQALILTKDGASWQRTVIHSSAVAGLTAVGVIPSSGAWAVGAIAFGTGSRPLTMRWNGRSWKKVPSPVPIGAYGALLGVVAPSRASAWAVGYAGISAGLDSRTLILHWNGTRWKRVRSPDPAPDGDVLMSVAAVSPTDIWAVGYTISGGGGRAPLILHGNGVTWNPVPTPMGSTGVLRSVAVSSAKDAWAVGYAGTAGHARSVILHWTGAAWQRIPGPAHLAATMLLGVTATSGRNAWAIGVDQDSASSAIIRWNGSAWH
jgi:hypothetical protein